MLVENWKETSSRALAISIRNSKLSNYHHIKKLVVKRCHYDVRKYSFASFCIRVVNIWNSLPNEVISATSVNSFKNRLDLFWADQEVLYNYKANITGNRGIKL